MSGETKPLRVCRVCGLQALTEEDLALFAPNKKSAHGRQNICKKCLKEQLKQRSHRTATDDPPGSTRCRVCGRLLTVAESVARGIGPVCWAKIQHNYTLEEYPEEAEQAQLEAEGIEAERAEYEAREERLAEHEREAAG